MMHSRTSPPCSTIPISLILLCILLLQHVVIQPAYAASDAERLSELKQLASSSRGKLISAPLSKFRSLLETAPRSYNLVVMFSADPQLCQPCAEMREHLRTASSDFSKTSTKQPSFFLEVKLSQSDAPFLSQYGIQHVPILYFFQSAKSKTYPKRLEESSPNSLNIQQVGFGANVIKQFINERTGSKMRVVRGGYEIAFVQTVRAYMPYIVAFVCVSALTAFVTGAYKSPMLWFLLVVLVYIFSVGGGHYSWIHNTPLAVVDKGGRTQYVAGGNRSQYVAEGFFVSFTCVCISALVIAIQELPSFVPYKSSQTVLGFMMFLLTIGAIGSLLSLYHMKMPSYLQYSEM